MRLCLRPCAETVNTYRPGMRPRHVFGDAHFLNPSRAPTLFTFGSRRTSRHVVYDVPRFVVQRKVAVRSLVVFAGAATIFTDGRAAADGAAARAAIARTTSVRRLRTG